VVLNKVDLPHVAERQAEVEAALLQLMGHKRLMAISAAQRVHTSELVRHMCVLCFRFDAVATEECFYFLVTTAVCCKSGEAANIVTIAVCYDVSCLCTHTHICYGSVKCFQKRFSNQSLTV
jgi:hypothetical protein